MAAQRVGLVPDTIGWVWTGEFDLNTLHMDGEIFESGKKKLRIPKISGEVWTGPDTIGWVWTGEFDLNTLHMDGEIFESGKKKLRIPKISGEVWTGP